MAVKLNGRAYSHARELIERGDFVNDEKDMWSEHQPSTKQENRFLEQHGFAEYGKWYLGIDSEQDEDNKGHYKFPYGDFEKYTDAESCPPNHERDSISTGRSRARQRTCMACSMRCHATSR